MAAANVLVSTSGHEGLSLAHLEALAADRPVVGTAVGGTPELAAGNPALRLVPVDAARQYAEVLAEIALGSEPSGRAAASGTSAAHGWFLPTAGSMRRRSTPTARRGRGGDFGW